MSSRAALTRMTREMKKWHIAGDPNALPAGCSVDLVGDSLLDLEARIAGPAGTPYDGGVFTLAVRLPAGYPFAKPEVHFKTKLLHPGVEPESGIICTTLLSEWSPKTTVATIVRHAQSMLVGYATGVGNPLNADALKQLTEDRAAFEAEAARLTKEHAQPE